MFADGTSMGQSRSAPGIRVDCLDLGRRFGSVTALPPVSFGLDPGSVLVVRGGNGTGKTTLLHCLAGRLAPTSGRVLLDGRAPDERRRDIRRDVALLSGTPGLFRDLTLADHLTLVDSTWGGDPDSCEDRVQQCLSDLGLTPLAERLPEELSSGQSRLFHLAVVLFRPARLLLLDEPEQRLDADRRELVAAVLRRRRDEGTTLVVATHDDVLAARVAGDTLTLDGRS